MDKTKTKEMEGEAKKVIEIILKHSPLANAEYSTYSGSWVVDAMIDYANNLRSELQKAKELNGELVDALDSALIGDDGWRKKAKALIKKSEI